jgi:TPR repeat protein
MRTSRDPIVLHFQAGRCSYPARKAVSLIALLASLSLGAVEAATAACTLDEIDACIKADPATAEELLLTDLSSSHGTEELTRLGEFYREAAAPFQSYSNATKYLQEAARAGDPQAMKSFAQMLINGEGTPADPNCAIALLEKAASNGFVGPSLITIGDYYYSMLDYQRALEAYQKASDAGDTLAMNRLAHMLLNGEGAAADPKKGIALLEQAIAEGLPGPSAAALGEYYREAGNPAKAIQAYQQASDVGEAAAMLSLADMLFKGEGIPADPEKAIALSQQAAAGGLVGAAYSALGEHYRGVGDFAKALAAYKRASEFGEKTATQALADMLFKGEGGKPAPEQATALLIRANLPVPKEGEPTDPPTTYTGKRVSVPSLVSTAFEAGFSSEEKLRMAVAVAVGESGLWTAARNWKPEWGFRQCDDDVTVTGPLSAWSDDQCQMHSDRGLWQISSSWWPQYSDRDTDDTKKAASATFVLSKEGTDFSMWDSYQSGYAQSLFDKSTDGWPALTPIVVNFLNSKSGKSRRVEWDKCLDQTRQ